MPQDITLLIPTHNRHAYLNRILDYYGTADFKILVADSSASYYDGIIKNPQAVYKHFPGMGLPQKLALAMQEIDTTFAVMCADDDFIIPSGIEACIDFLQSNKSFTAAQGNTVCYFKNSIKQNAVRFSAMYFNQLSFEIAADSPLKRIEKLFDPYRTIFCAVHYTKVLQTAFSKDLSIGNLFLNEYLSGIIPVALGKYKELNVFYQVRENADDSGDKSTDNIDRIVSNDKYKIEYDNYLNYVSTIIAAENNLDKSICKQTVVAAFERFAKELNNTRSGVEQQITLKKKIGNLVGKVPLIGKQIVLANRDAERKRFLSLIVKNTIEQKELERVEHLIKRYSNAITG